MSSRPRLVIPTLAEVESALGEPASAWVARCYEIACAVVERGLVRGIAVAVYGHWTGPISPRSYFADKWGAGFCRHGWVSLADGRVLDPTRWVFEAAQPYLYVGPADHYDEGGNAIRTALSPKTMPQFEAGERFFVLSHKTMRSAGAREVVRLLMPGAPWTWTRLCAGQVHWLANRDPRSLGGHAPEIFAWICRIGKEAYIPIDNKRMVDEGRVNASGAGASNTKTVRANKRRSGR